MKNNYLLKLFLFVILLLSKEAFSDDSVIVGAMLPPVQGGWGLDLGCNYQLNQCPPPASDVPSGYVFSNFGVKDDHVDIYLYCTIRPQRGVAPEDREHFTWQQTNGAACYYVRKSCPIGQDWFAHPELGNSAGSCEAPYKLASPYEPSPPDACALKLNPIDISSGAKIQSEVDIVPNGIGQVTFSRTYNSGVNSLSSTWYNNYNKKIRVIDSSTANSFRYKSSGYAKKSDACVSGWNDIQPQITDSWGKSVTPVFDGVACQLQKNGVVVKTLPIINETSAPIMAVSNFANINTTSMVQLIQPDGSVRSYKWTVGFGATTSVDNKGTLIRVDDNLWRHFNENGDIEDFSVDGKLMAITASNGMKQTLTYDSTSGLLSQVQDSVGGKLTFAYTNNLLSSVTTSDNKTTRYAYNALGLITDVQRSDSTHRLYFYEDTRFPTFLTGITDERGVRFVTWTYDAQGRAITSQHAGGADFGSLAITLMAVQH